MARQVALNWYKTLQAKLAGYPPYIADIVIFAPLGLVLGFLLRSLGRYLIVGLLIAVGLVWLADYFKLVTLHQAEIQSFFSFSTHNSLNDLGKEFTVWAQEHVIACVTFLVSFLIGWKLGL